MTARMKGSASRMMKPGKFENETGVVSPKKIYHQSARRKAVLYRV